MNLTNRGKLYCKGHQQSKHVVVLLLLRLNTLRQVDKQLKTGVSGRITDKTGGKTRISLRHAEKP